MNRAWHDAHVMPRNATLEQRLSWHLDHAQQCACRPIPASVLKVMTERGIAVPPRPGH